MAYVERNSTVVCSNVFPADNGSRGVEVSAPAGLGEWRQAGALPFDPSLRVVHQSVGPWCDRLAIHRLCRFDPPCRRGLNQIDASPGASTAESTGVSTGHHRLFFGRLFRQSPHFVLFHLVSLSLVSTVVDYFGPCPLLWTWLIMVDVLRVSPVRLAVASAFAPPRLR